MSQDEWDNFWIGSGHELFLKDNRLTQSSAQYLRSQLEATRLEKKKAKRMETIRLHNCSFENEEAIRALVDFMAFVGNEFHGLHISEQIPVMSSPNLALFIRGLARVCHLQKIRFTGLDMLTRHVGQALSVLLQAPNHALQEIKLVGCYTRLDSFREFLEGLRNHPAGLKRLEITYCQSLGDHCLELLVSALLESASKEALEALVIGQHPTLTEISCGSFALVLEQCRRIQELSIQGCSGVFRHPNQGGASVQRFLNAVARSQSLERLDLSSCCCASLPNGSALFQILARRDNLRVLSLGDNDLDEEALTDLAYMLEKSTSLEDMHISDNTQLFDSVQADNVNFRAFVNALRTNVTLERLSMNRCGITNATATFLLQVLKENKTLQNLEMFHRKVDMTECLAACLPEIVGLVRLRARFDLESAALRRALQQNTSVTSVLQHYNSAPAKEIQQIMRRNSALKTIVPRLVATAEQLRQEHWPGCVERLLGSCISDPSPLYVFVKATSLAVSSWREGSRKQPRLWE